MSLADLKRKSKASLEKLNSELTKLNKTYTNDDDDKNFWRPDVDKAGNGYAVIRFLPAPDGEDVPFVRIWDHGFQGPGGWYIEKSLTTIGEADPVGEYNKQLWDSGIEANKEIVRKQKRRLTFISNVYIIKDTLHPENEGKVMLFKYGKKIFDKLNAAMNPEFEDEKPINPFDLWEGANFKVKIRNVEGYRNYDNSSFDTAGALFEDDDQLETVWNSYAKNPAHSLSQFVHPSKFKSYDELKAKLYRVLALGAAPHRASGVGMIEEEHEAPAPKAKAAPAPKAPSLDEDDDDSLDFFKKLAEEDN
jgi:hypothetical protein